MPKLTVPTLAKYKPQKERREIRDTLAPGLRLIIQPSGARSWAMRFRRPDGRPAKLTLGKYVEVETGENPVIGAALTLSQARELAIRVDRERTLGKDVIEERKAEKSRRRDEDKDRAENTFGVLAVEFFRSYRTKWGARPRRWRNDAAILGLRWPDSDPSKTDPTVVEGSLADIWRDKAVASIDGHDVHTVVDEARKLGVPGLAKRNDGVSENRGRKLHAALSVFFRWLVRQRRVAVNPCAGVWRPQPPAARDRVLSDDEIKSFWLATDAVGEPFRAALRLLLLTGARVSEITGMRRSELGDGGTWTIPGARTKNHRPHAVPLPLLALDILAAVPRIEGDLVFTTTRNSPVSGWSK